MQQLQATKLPRVCWALHDLALAVIVSVGPAPILVNGVTMKVKVAPGSRFERVNVRLKLLFTVVLSAGSLCGQYCTS